MGDCVCEHASGQQYEVGIKGFAGPRWDEMLSRQSLLVVALQFAQAGLAALNVILIAIVLEPTAYGQYVYWLTIASIAPLFAGLGTEHVFIMEASRHRELATVYFGNAVFVRAIVSTFLFIGIGIGANLTSPENFQTIMLISGGSLLAMFPSPLFMAYYRVQSAYIRPLVMGLVGPLAFLAFLALRADRIVSIEHISVAFCLTNALVLLLYLMDMRRFVRLQVDWERLKTSLRDGMVFSVSQAFDFIFSRIDIFLLKFVAGPHLLGIYAAAQRIVSLLQLIPSSFHIVELAEFHRAASDPARLTVKFRQLRGLLFEIGLFVFGILIINADGIVHLLFGNHYQEAGRVVVVLSIASLLLFINYPYYMLAEAERQLERRLMMRIITFGITVPSMIGLIAVFDEAGAALGLIVGQAFFCILLHLITCPTNGGMAVAIRDARIAGFSVLGFMLAFALETILPDSGTTSLASTAVYVGALFGGAWWLKGSPSIEFGRELIIRTTRTRA